MCFMRILYHILCLNTTSKCKSILRNRKNTTKQNYYWQRKLRKIAKKELSEPKVAQLSADLIQVNTTNLQNSKGAEVIIEIGKFRILANDITNMDLLAKICKLLTELPWRLKKVGQSRKLCKWYNLSKSHFRFIRGMFFRLCKWHFLTIFSTQSTPHKYEDF